MKLVDDQGIERDFFFEVSKYSAFLWKSHIERHLALYELYKLTCQLPGSVVEFGVYNGSTFYFLARLIEIFNAPQYEKHGSSSHHLYGFDTFEGIADLDKEDASCSINTQSKVKGFYQDKDVFFRDFEMFKKDSTISKRLHIIEGDVMSTWPKFIESNPGVRFRYALMDLDLYEPTKVVLESILEYMVRGGVIVFDEYAMPEWPGETKAVDSFLRKNGLQLKALPFAFAPSAYVVVD